MTHGIVNCKGFKVVMIWPWVHDFDNKYNPSFKNQDDLKWGFIICKPSVFKGSSDKYNIDKLYGVIGPIRIDYIRESCLGIPLHEEQDISIALAKYAISCGLSIVKKADVELGDTVVVSGVNPLALSVIIAAKSQGTNILCLTHYSELRSPQMKDIKKLSDEVIEFEYTAYFEARFIEIIASSKGKTIYIDAAGDPERVYSMAVRLKKFETLVFCRPDAHTSLMVNLRSIHHLKSAKFIYWGKADNLEDALIWKDCYRRAANLFNYKRVLNYIPNLYES